jgi:hypothetical protein
MVVKRISIPIPIIVERAVIHAKPRMRSLAA